MARWEYLAIDSWMLIQVDPRNLEALATCIGPGFPERGDKGARVRQKEQQLEVDIGSFGRARLLSALGADGWGVAGAYGHGQACTVILKRPVGGAQIPTSRRKKHALGEICKHNWRHRRSGTRRGFGHTDLRSQEDKWTEVEIS